MFVFVFAALLRVSMSILFLCESKLCDREPMLNVILNPDVVLRRIQTKMSRAHSLSFLNTVTQIRFHSGFTGLRPRRSLLYVPGNETKKINKAAGLSADVVVLDCEDGVAQSMKVDY